MLNLPWYILLLGGSIVTVYVLAIVLSIIDKTPSNDDYHWW